MTMIGMSDMDTAWIMSKSRDDVRRGTNPGQRILWEYKEGEPHLFESQLSCLVHCSIDAQGKPKVHIRVK